MVALELVVDVAPKEVAPAEDEDGSVEVDDGTTPAEVAKDPLEDADSAEVPALAPRDVDDKPEDEETREDVWEVDVAVTAAEDPSATDVEEPPPIPKDELDVESSSSPGSGVGKHAARPRNRAAERRMDQPGYRSITGHLHG